MPGILPGIRIEEALDEFPEFGTRVLEVMRQPMGDKVVVTSRAKGSLTFSVKFQLIVAILCCA
jgi:magnesium chelatase family protein